MPETKLEYTVYRPLIDLELLTIYVHSLIPRPLASSALGCFNRWHHYMTSLRPSLSSVGKAWEIHHTLVVMLNIYTLQVYCTQLYCRSLGKVSLLDKTLQGRALRCYAESYLNLCHKWRGHLNFRTGSGEGQRTQATSRIWLKTNTQKH